MAHAQNAPSAGEEWWTPEKIPSGERRRNLDARSPEPRIAIQSKNASNQLSYSFGRKEQISDRPSIGRRILRSLIRFFAVVLIGVAATLAWQSYGDTAREAAVARIPMLAWLWPVSATKPPVTAAPSLQQSESWAANLEMMRRSLEQLAARQEQMAENIAALQEVDEDIRKKMSFTPVASQPLAQQKPAQPRAQVPRPQTAGASLSAR
jgi:hypothetical protein